MNQRRVRSLASSGVVALAAVAALTVLAGCDEQPYSTPTHTAAPAAQPSTELMGAPEASVAPPEAEAPAYPPPAYAPPPPPVYAPAPAYGAGAYAPGAVVAMAPIPNPPEEGAYDSGVRHYRLHARYQATGVALGNDAVRSHRGARHGASARHATAAIYAAAPAYVPPRPPAIAQAARPNRQAAAPTTPRTVAANAKPASSQAHVNAASIAPGSAALHGRRAEVHARRAALKGGDHTSRLAALQSALSDAVARTAVLSTPASFAPNQPRDVSLTLPAAFADTARREAHKDGLGDAAASVKLNVNLAGDGFLVTPSDVQSAPLASGQLAEFRWTVTARPGAKGPLHADVSADLLGGGDQKLALGSVEKPASVDSGLGVRVFGIALLVLIVTVALAWLARRRNYAQSPAVRRAARRASPPRTGPST